MLLSPKKSPRKGSQIKGSGIGSRIMGMIGIRSQEDPEDSLCDYMGTLSLEKKVLSPVEMKKEKIKIDEFNKKFVEILTTIQIELPNACEEVTDPSNLAEILLAACSQFSDMLLFSPIVQTWFMELIAGLLGRYNSNKLVKTIIKLYPELLPYQQLNAIFIVKEIILLDNFHYGPLRHNFINSIKKFSKLIQRSNNEKQFDELSGLLFCLVASKKKLLSPEYYELNSSIKRVESTELIDMDVLLRTVNKKSAAEILANELSLISLTYYQSLEVLEFAKLNSKKSTPILSKINEFSDKLTNYFAGMILKQDQHITRIKIVTIYIWTIKQFLLKKSDILDIYSALILFGTLEIREVDRLSSIFANLDKKTHKQLGEIQKTLGSWANYKELNSRIQERQSQNKQYIPFVPIQIGELTRTHVIHKWPLNFIMPGRIYLSICEIQEGLRNHCLSNSPKKFKTNLMQAAETWTKDNDWYDERSTAIQPRAQPRAENTPDSKENLQPVDNAFLNKKEKEEESGKEKEAVKPRRPSFSNTGNPVLMLYRDTISVTNSEDLHHPPLSPQSPGRLRRGAKN